MFRRSLCCTAHRAAPLLLVAASKGAPSNASSNGGASSAPHHQRRWYQQATGQARVERQVEADAAAAAAAPKPPGADLAKLKADMAAVDPARIDKVAVWGLWNEGNLFSLSVVELAAFLTKQEAALPAELRKSTLVRAVEAVMVSYSPPTTTATDDTVASITKAHLTTIDAPHGGTEYAEDANVFDEADEYGDWGADPGFEEKRGIDFMTLRSNRESSRGFGANAATTEHLGSHAFQLLHEEVTSNVALAQFNASKLPGCTNFSEAYAVSNIAPADANRLAFRSAFQWSASSLWNLGLDGEINIGVGKALYKRAVAKRNRSVLPAWTCQDHLQMAHPFVWFAVAADSNVEVVERLASELGMTAAQSGPEVSFKLGVQRSRDLLDVELNEQLQPTLINKPWERIYACHYLRARLPDLRYLIRARRPIKKKIVEAYMDSRMIAKADDLSVKSVLSPELGEVRYCCERVKRRWTTQLDSGVSLSIVETKRKPLISLKPDDAERLEYELIANIPQRAEKVDLHALSDELWARGNQMATLMEEGMAEFQAHTMSSAAAFDARTAV